jgi:hypothetical protein
VTPAAIAGTSADPTKAIVFERTPAAGDSDTSTAQTIQKMCEYIRGSIDDPGVRSAAEYAALHFAAGSTSPMALAWAVWWYVKHCVKFRQDEATMFRIGRQNEFDLLIAPSVLVRMSEPAEDCDGFTMLTAALCKILGVPVFIATIAADGRTPARFSHVFCCAMVDGNVLPLDTSHGNAPGWMVPRQQIYRWQAWDLDARPIDVAPSTFQGLHGYSRRGMGDALTDSFLVDAGLDPTAYNTTTGGGTLVDGVLQSGPTMNPSGSGLDLGSFFANLFGDAASVAKVAVAPTTSIRLPNGSIVSGVSPAQAGSILGSSSFTSMMPILGIGLVALVALSFLGGKK